jgi:hypothetical protein
MLLRGSLSDTAGQPVQGMREVTLSLYTAASGGEPFFREQQTVMVQDGELTVSLGAATPLDLARFLDEGEVYLGVAVGDEAEMTPRARMNSVPYAAVAQHVRWDSISGIPAAVEDGYQAGAGLALTGNSFSVDPSLFQRRLAAACGDDQALAGIDADGNPTCVPLAAALSGACPPGSLVSGILDGALQCAPDANPVIGIVGGGLVFQSMTLALIFGQAAQQVAEGNDRRFPPNPDEDGWLTYTLDDRWVALHPGNQGDLLHTRSPDVGPPYWGPLLAEEVPPAVKYYIWNQNENQGVSPQSPQSASLNITGGGTFGGAGNFGGNLHTSGDLDVDDDANIDGDLVVTNSATVGSLTIDPLGTPIGKLAFGEVDLGSFQNCPTIEVEVCIPDPVDQCIGVNLPLGSCEKTIEFDLPADFSSPQIFLSTRNSSGSDTFSASWHPVDLNTIVVSVVRTDLPGGGWDNDLIVQWLALD